MAAAFIMPQHARYPNLKNPSLKNKNPSTENMLGKGRDAAEKL